jgi:hypothetical protein
MRTLAEQRERPFAIVTGASRGIGAAYARALAATGYDLLLVGRDKARLDRIASELIRRHGGTVEPEVMNLAESGAAHQLYTAARQRRHHVDLLVLNAGFGLFGDFATMPLPRIREMLRLHLEVNVESVRLFLPSMIERGSGGIIIVASLAGLLPVPYLAEYAATKAFLISFSESLAEEIRPSGVRVQVCCPGSTATDFHATAAARPKGLFNAQEPTQVVRTSLAALERGRTLVPIGWKGRVMVWLTRHLPRTLLVRAAAQWMKQHP